MPDSTVTPSPSHNSVPARYVIGLDYGTESARAMLLRASDGQQLTTAVHRYEHGVMEGRWRGQQLPGTYALQDGDDYLRAAEDILQRVVQALPEGAEVAGIGVAFTSSTPLPISKDGQPLSRIFPENPHAYVKLWKHRAALEHLQPFRKLDSLPYYGGTSSPEWLPSKANEIAHEAPEIWQQTASFVEAGDWLSAQLCGETAPIRSESHAGFKTHFRGGQYPAEVSEILAERLGDTTLPLGASIGRLSEEWQRRLALPNQPMIAVSAIDAHAAAVGLGLIEDGDFTAILGTSAVYLLSSHQEIPIAGICGVVKDGISAGQYGYEAGQASFGDVLNWFVRTYPAEAQGTESRSFELYNAQAEQFKPGEHGLLGLDWFNGCRTPLDRGDLSGLLLGYNTTTTRADIYRALIESLCFGARRVIETFTQVGIDLKRITLTGGLSERHMLLVQILSDVLGRPLEVSLAEHASARGAAIHAAVASGVFADFPAAAQALADRRLRTVEPNMNHHRVYTQLYQSYLQLSELLAASPVMADVQGLAAQIREAKEVQ